MKNYHIESPKLYREHVKKHYVNYGSIYFHDPNNYCNFFIVFLQIEIPNVKSQDFSLSALLLLL